MLYVLTFVNKLAFLERNKIQNKLGRQSVLQTDRQTDRKRVVKPFSEKIMKEREKNRKNSSQIQGGSNMTGTDLRVNKPHCAAAVRP